MTATNTSARNSNLYLSSSWRMVDLARKPSLLCWSCETMPSQLVALSSGNIIRKLIQFGQLTSEKQLWLATNVSIRRMRVRGDCILLVETQKWSLVVTTCWCLSGFISSPLRTHSTKDLHSTKYIGFEFFSVLPMMEIWTFSLIKFRARRLLFLHDSNTYLDFHQYFSTVWSWTKIFFFDMYHCLQATQTTSLISNRFLNFRVMAKVDYKSKPYTTLNL